MLLRTSTTGTTSTLISGISIIIISSSNNSSRADATSLLTLCAYTLRGRTGVYVGLRSCARTPACMHTYAIFTYAIVWKVVRIPLTHHTTNIFQMLTNIDHILTNIINLCPNHTFVQNGMSRGYQYK